MQWCLAALRNYVGFFGRARHKKHWMFTLVNATVNAIIDAIQLILGLEFPLLPFIYLATTIIPVIALCVRHLHDIDRSNVWVLLYLVPIISWLLPSVFACLEGNSGGSRYGNDPKFGPS